jgi:hypothetical protein
VDRHRPLAPRLGVDRVTERLGRGAAGEARLALLDPEHVPVGGRELGKPRHLVELLVDRAVVAPRDLADQVHRGHRRRGASIPLAV